VETAGARGDEFPMRPSHDAPRRPCVNEFKGGLRDLLHLAHATEPDKEFSSEREEFGPRLGIECQLFVHLVKHRPGISSLCVLEFQLPVAEEIGAVRCNVKTIQPGYVTVSPPDILTEHLDAFYVWIRALERIDCFHCLGKATEFYKREHFAFQKLVFRLPLFYARPDAQTPAIPAYSLFQMAVEME
jgi:hypothetical protein